jgi:hypothetical protein
LRRADAADCARSRCGSLGGPATVAQPVAAAHHGACQGHTRRTGGPAVANAAVVADADCVGPTRRSSSLRGASCSRGRPGFVNTKGPRSPCSRSSTGAMNWYVRRTASATWQPLVQALARFTSVPVWHGFAPAAGCRECGGSAHHRMHACRSPYRGARAQTSWIWTAAIKRPPWWCCRSPRYRVSGHAFARDSKGGTRTAPAQAPVPPAGPVSPPRIRLVRIGVHACRSRA